jgi:hypothetical protein
LHGRGRKPDVVFSTVALPRPALYLTIFSTLSLVEFLPYVGIEPYIIWFDFHRRQKLYSRGVEKITRYSAEMRQNQQLSRHHKRSAVEKIVRLSV